MERVVELRQAGVGAVHGQRVLDEVVGPDRQKVHTLDQDLGQVDRSRHLDHHADPRPRRVLPLFLQLSVGPFQQPQCLVELADRPDHGKQDLKIA